MYTCKGLKQKVKDLMSWSYLKHIVVQSEEQYAHKLDSNYLMQILITIYYVYLLSSYHSRQMRSCIIIAMIKSTKLVVTWLDPSVQKPCKYNYSCEWWFAPRNEPNMSHLALYTLSGVRPVENEDTFSSAISINFPLPRLFSRLQKHPLVALQCFTTLDLLQLF